MIFFNYRTETFNELSKLCSKVSRYFLKNYVGHTVHTQIEELKELPLTVSISKKGNLHVSSILESQKENSNYDYGSYEQIEIDKLVYESYGLNAEDVEEVENWYARRYPKLSAAQRANLRKLGKSDDYLELYGLREKENQNS